MSKKLKVLLIILIFITLGTGFYSKKLDDSSKNINQLTVPKLNNNEQNKFIATIYFPNPSINKLTSSNVEFDYSSFSKQEILKDIIDILFLKLEELEILKKENYKYEVYIRNKTIYLDLDSRILHSAKTPQEELLLIYSFVNTILSMAGNDELVLLIDGYPSNKVNFIKINKSYKINRDI